MSQGAARNPYDHEKSVRLTAAQAERLERASRASGVKPSDLMRAAIEQRCNEVLGGSLAEDLADYIGVLDLGGEPGARRSREVFGEVVSAKLDPAKRRTRR